MLLQISLFAVRAKKSRLCFSAVAVSEIQLTYNFHNSRNFFTMSTISDAKITKKSYHSLY